MLAVVKAPHIDLELSFNGSGIEDFLSLIRKHYKVDIIHQTPADNANEFIDAEKSEFWKENKFRVLTGARLKAGFSQAKLAEKCGIRQSVICEYENGKRRITPKAAQKLATALNTYPEKFL